MGRGGGGGREGGGGTTTIPHPGYCNTISGDGNTVEPQSYGLRSYGNLGQPDTNKYLVSTVKVAIKFL